MKTLALFVALAVAALPLFAADPGPKDEVLAAAKKLDDKPGYAWKTTVVVPESAQFKPGPSEGKTTKEGITHVSLNFGDNTTQIYLRGDKAVANSDGNWQTLSELENEEGPARFLAFIIRNFKTPVAQTEELATAAKELKKEGDAFTSELTEEGAKKQFRWGNVTNPKGSVKFWLKDGQLAKLQFKLTGKVDFNGNEIDVDRDTTIEIKDVGATKVEVPEAAMKKLNPPLPPTQAK